jgi:hypothetical protein
MKGNPLFIRTNSFVLARKEPWSSVPDVKKYELNEQRATSEKSNNLLELYQGRCPCIANGPMGHGLHLRLAVTHKAYYSRAALNLTC